MDIVELGWGDVDWIGLAQDRDKWRAHVNAIWTFVFYKLLGNCRMATQLVASRAVFNSIELVNPYFGSYVIVVPAISL
jgi:hypothetical protein